MKRPIESPCINVCVIDASTALCAGCSRSLDEIARWAAMTDDGAPTCHARAALEAGCALDKPRRGEMGAWVALTLLVIAGLALLLRADAGSIAGYDPSDFAIAVASVALLIFLGSSIAGSYRGRAGPRRPRSSHLVDDGAAAGRRIQLSRGDLQPRPPCRRRAAAAGQRAARQRGAGRRRAVRAHPAAARRAFRRQDAGQRRVVEHADRYRCFHRSAQAGRCPEVGHRCRPAEISGARADRQRHHLCRACAPAQPDAWAHQPQRRRGAGGQARIAQGEPARYEFLKPPALL